MKRTKTCHLCFDENVPEKYRFVCSVPRCSQMFCQTCIHQSFDKNFEQKQFKKDCWVCYSCGKTCKCNICQGVLPEKKKKSERALKAKAENRKVEILIEKEKKSKEDERIVENIHQKTHQKEVKVEEDAHGRVQSTQPLANPNIASQNQVSNLFQRYYSFMYQPNSNPVQIQSPYQYPYSFYYYMP